MKLACLPNGLSPLFCVDGVLTVPSDVDGEGPNDDDGDGVGDSRF